MTNQEFYKISLPKWPECRVDGESVTKEQAQEILIRTQDFHISTKEDHAGISLTVGVLGYGVHFHIYDHRHEDMR
jgi:hypothetical protein